MHTKENRKHTVRIFDFIIIVGMVGMLATTLLIGCNNEVKHMMTGAVRQVVVGDAPAAAAERPEASGRYGESASSYPFGRPSRQASFSPKK